MLEKCVCYLNILAGIFRGTWFMPRKFIEQTLPHNDWQLCGFQERLWYLI